MGWFSGRSPGRLIAMAQLLFFSGTMDSGKSTLALQMDHNQRHASTVCLDWGP